MSTEAEQFLTDMLPKQRAAEQAIHNGDPEPRSALWTRNDPVTVFGAGMNGFGWAEVEPHRQGRVVCGAGHVAPESSGRARRATWT